jgi:hypothetical protein
MPRSRLKYLFGLALVYLVLGENAGANNGVFAVAASASDCDHSEAEKEQLGEAHERLARRQQQPAVPTILWDTQGLLIAKYDEANEA